MELARSAVADTLDIFCVRSSLFSLLRPVVGIQHHAVSLPCSIFLYNVDMASESVHLGVSRLIDGRAKITGSIEER
jgi:hypothetical protein